MIQYVFDKVLIPGERHKLLLIPAGIIGLYVLNFFIRFLHYYLLRVVIVRIDQQLKNRIFEHLLGLSADYFSEKSTGSLMSRTHLDPHFITLGLSSINVVAREPVTFLFLLGYTLYLNWRLTLITFLIFPPLTWLFSAVNRNLKRYISRLQGDNELLYAALNESYSGIRMIKAFRLENYVISQFHRVNEKIANQYLKISRLEEAAHPAIELMIALVVSGLLAYGGLAVIEGRMSKGDLMSYFVAFGLMVQPIRSLGEINIKLSQASAAADRIFDLLSWKSNLVEPKKNIPVKEFHHSIEFDSVGFAYPDAPERKVLNGVSFTVPKGKMVALVGASGAGKSSLVTLLPRIFDVTAGVIRVDGHDIRDLNLGDLRHLIAVVSQDVFLFNDTIEQNIRCGRLDATHDEVLEAARHAYALDFIEESPMGFKTVIGDRGQKLSGGQRQRIAIARAFLRQAPILILDEATSALDTASEKVVQTALNELMKSRTTIVIAHRLSTIQNADQILVMKEGRIVESGKHDELLARMGGEYSKLHLASLNA